MGDLARNVIAGFGIGSAIRDRKWKDDEKDFEQEKRDRYRSGLKALDTFLSDQFDESSAPVQPAAGGITVQNPKDAIDGVQSPVAQGTGFKPQQPGGEPVFRAPDLDEAQKKIADASMLAAKHPEIADQLKGWQVGYTQAAMYKHQQGFTGDLNTREGLQDYSKYMAAGAAKLGGVMSPGQAKKNYDFISDMKKEGYQEALDKFHVGDLEGGIKAWKESGKMKGTFSGYKPSSFKLGGVEVPGYEVTYTSEDGETQVLNTAAMKFQAEAFQKQVDGTMTAGRDKVKADDTKADNTRADKKLDSEIDDAAKGRWLQNKQISSQGISLVAGEDDNYAHNKLTGETVALGTGIKKSPTSSGRDGFGRTGAELSALKKSATMIFDKSINVSTGEFGLKGLKTEDGKLYSAVTNAMYQQIIDGRMSDSQAADYGKDLATEVYLVRRQNKALPESKRYADEIGEAVKRINERYGLAGTGTGSGGGAQTLEQMLKALEADPVTE